MNQSKENIPKTVCLVFFKPKCNAQAESEQPINDPIKEHT